VRLAVLNQREGGGATVQALALLEQARGAGFATSYHPDRDDVGEDDLIRRLRDFRPDVVHAHCFYNAWRPDVLKRIGSRWPAVFTLHDVYAVNQFGTECWECDHNAFCWACPAVPLFKRPVSLYRIRSRRARERAWHGLEAHVVYPTEWMRRRTRRTALARRPGTVIPYGIDTGAFAPDPGARARLRLDAGTPVILCIGSMYSPRDDRKGFAFLFDAFARVVRPEVPRARLVVIGRVFGLATPEGAEILASVGRDDVRSWCAAADVVAQPSLGDQAPLAILEAMASGAAVVATRVGGIPEEVEDGVTGILVPPRDAGALGGALLRVLREPGLARGFGAAGRSRAVARFGIARAWDAHAALYRRVASAWSATSAP
jgi:glycosyltransferase involved in cell wall biosynthesis